MNSLARLLMGSCLIASILSTGCGAPGNAAAGNARATGKVSYKGAPLTTGGTIRFQLATDPGKFGTVSILPDGTYSIPNAPLGECLVAIENESQMMMMPPAQRKTFKPLKKVYADALKSNLKATIGSGENEVNFDLE